MPKDYTLNGQLVLKINDSDKEFATKATHALDKIVQTAAGRTLLERIATNRAAGKNVGIASAAASACACVSPDSSVSRTKLAQSIFDDQGDFRQELTDCLTAAGHANDSDWLATQINQAPVYNIRQPPGNAPSNLGVTGAQVAAWLNGTAVFPHPFTAANASRLERALLVALWPQASQVPRRGTGAHSKVLWNSGSKAIHLANGEEQARSKAIGLAHELIHAYYNGCGLQMGRDNPEPGQDGEPTQPSAVLYEFMCVGLGIWAGETVSENKIRDQWNTVVKRKVGPIKMLYSKAPPRPQY